MQPGGEQKQEGRFKNGKKVLLLTVTCPLKLEGEDSDFYQIGSKLLTDSTLLDLVIITA